MISTREPLRTEPKIHYLTQKTSDPTPASAKRHKRSMLVNKPTFERVVPGSGPFAKVEESFSDTSHIGDLHTLEQEGIEKETEKSEKNKGFMQPLLDRKHILSNYAIPMYEANNESFVPWWVPEITTKNSLKILYEGPVVASKRPISKPTVQNSLLSGATTLQQVEAPKNIKEANKRHYRRSVILNPKFEAIFDFKRQYESFQHKFLRAFDYANEAWRKRTFGNSAALPQIEKPENRGNMEGTTGDFSFKKLHLPKFAISQFFKPSFSYAGPIDPYDESIVPSSSVNFALPRSTLVDTLSALKVPLTRKTFQFNSGNTDYVQDILNEPEQIKPKDASAFELIPSNLNTGVNFSRFIPSSLNETSKLSRSKVPTSPSSYQYVQGPSRTSSNFSSSTIPQVKYQSFEKANAQFDSQWTQKIFNSTKDFPDFNLKFHRNFEYNLKLPKTHENNFKASELVPVRPNVSLEKLPRVQSLKSLKNFLSLSLPLSQVDFAPRITTNKPTGNIQSVREPAESQKMVANASELNLLKPQDFSNLRLPSSHSQVGYFYKITSTTSRSLLKSSEAHKNYSGFLDLILPKSRKLSLFQSKPAPSRIVDMLNVTSSPINTQHIQPTSLNSSTNIFKIGHGSPKLPEIVINIEVSNSTIPLLPKEGSSMQFSSPVFPVKYSSGLSLPRSHGDFFPKVSEIHTDATKINASKFDTSQQMLSTPKVSRHHQFAAESSNVLLAPLHSSQISNSKSNAGNFLGDLPSSVSSSQSHNAVESPKKHNIDSDALKVFTSIIAPNRSQPELSRLHVPKDSLVQPFKSGSESSHSPGNTNKLLSRFEFQSFKPSSIKSSTKPVPHTPIRNHKDPERTTRDTLLPQLLEGPIQFVNPTSTHRPVVSTNLPQSSSSKGTLSWSAAPSMLTNTVQQPTSSHKVPLANLPNALRENIRYTYQFVPGMSENSSKLKLETTTLKMLIMEPEVNAFSSVPLPSITKYHNFHSKKKASPITSHTDSERKEIVMKSGLQQGHIETATSTDWAASTLSNTTTTTVSYRLPSVSKKVSFTGPFTSFKNKTLILDQSGSTLLSSTTPLFKRTVPNVVKTHIFKKISELPKTEETPQRDTTLNPLNLVISQHRNRTLVPSSESSTPVAKIESQQSQQISTAPTRKQVDNNRLGKESNATSTHIRYVKRRRIRPGTSTRTVLQNQNDQPFNVTKLRLVKNGGVLKMAEILSSEHVMGSPKNRGVIRRSMPSVHSHFVPSTNNNGSSRSNERSLDFKGISESHRSDTSVKLEAFPVNSRKSSNGAKLSNLGSSDILHEGMFAVNASSERVKSKKNLVVTLLKKEKFSENVPENSVAADIKIL
ncbi:uncharacterized protein [Euwallacea fornicatus]|uniref:uncharacterized protein n=1 Tax=Euwallacea fornicatus TaxID=995702 RepID=UPI00338F65C6